MKREVTYNILFLALAHLNYNIIKSNNVLWSMKQNNNVYIFQEKVYRNNILIYY